MASAIAHKINILENQYRFLVRPKGLLIFVKIFDFFLVTQSLSAMIGKTHF